MTRVTRTPFRRHASAAPGCPQTGPDETMHRTTTTRHARTLPAEPGAAVAARRGLAAFITAQGGSRELRDTAELAAAEALNNAVVHAYRDRAEAGPVHLEAEVDGGELVVRVRDEGVGLSPRDDSPGCGFGLGLMTKLAHRVCVDHLRPGTEVRMHFPWATA